MLRVNFSIFRLWIENAKAHWVKKNHEAALKKVVITDFKKFLNLTCSDAKDKIIQYFGPPSRVSSGLESGRCDIINYVDENDDPLLCFLCDKDSGRLSVIYLEPYVENISRAIEFIEGNGVKDLKIHFLGKHRDFILSQFGQPTRILPNKAFTYEGPYYEYSVEFSCSATDNYICSGITVNL